MDRSPVSSAGEPTLSQSQPASLLDTTVIDSITRSSTAIGTDDTSTIPTAPEGDLDPRRFCFEGNHLGIQE